MAHIPLPVLPPLPPLTLAAKLDSGRLTATMTGATQAALSKARLLLDTGLDASGARNSLFLFDIPISPQVHGDGRLCLDSLDKFTVVFVLQLIEADLTIV